jgi:hypothetical protein
LEVIVMKRAMLGLLAVGILLTPFDGFARSSAGGGFGGKGFRGGFAAKPFHRPAMHRLGQRHFTAGSPVSRSFHRGGGAGTFFGSRHAFGNARHAGFRHAHIQRGFGIPITWLGGTGFYGSYYDPSDYAGIYDPGSAPAASDAPREACRRQEVVVTDSPNAVVVLRC